MKTKMKLKLAKQTITNLNENEMKVYGGYTFTCLCNSVQLDPECDSNADCTTVHREQ